MRVTVIGLIICLFASISLKAIETRDSIPVKGTMYEYVLNIPQVDTAIPLIINLHGWSMDISLHRKLSRMDALVHRQGVMVVHPQAPDEEFAWNPPEDIHFIKQLIHNLKRDYKVDNNRIYVVGFSSGGFFAHYLANKLSGTIAAVASVEGGIRDNWSLQPPAQGVPVLIIHNKYDVRTKYLEYGVPSYNQWIAWNKCDTVAETSIYNFDPFVSLKINPNGRDNSTVHFYTFDLKMGNGHMWPYRNMCGMEASEVIWKFFEELE
ncbi:MAG: hypothetical protein K9I94_04410 [Bacteroidales bacterium]|nr:hypothetical protein [Bacteroidales bacterium]